MQARFVTALFVALSLIACKGPQATTEELAEGSAAAVVDSPDEASGGEAEGSAGADEASAPPTAEEASTAEVTQDADAGYAGDANPLMANPGAQNNLATSPEMRPRLQLNTVRPGGLRPRLDNLQLQPYRPSIGGTSTSSGISPATPQRSMGPTNGQPVVERRGQVQ